MSTLHPRFTARIEGPPEIIFDLIADMPNYGDWLPGSEAFGGTTEVSPYPVRLGTTYLDAGPAGQRPGSVTGYENETIRNYRDRIRQCETLGEYAMAEQIRQILMRKHR